MADLKPSATLSIHHADISDVVKAFSDRAKALSWGEIFFIFLLTMLVMVGNAMQVISLNFWLRDFPGSGASNFTAFAVSNLFFCLFFFVIFVVYYIRNRPDLRFLWTKKSMWLLMVIGFGDMANSELNIYATKATPEILQTLFNSCQPIFCFIFSRWILDDKRNWKNGWCLISFALMIIGVCVASGPDFADGSDMSTSKKWWSFLYFLSTPMQSWYNVVQGQYMETFTDKEKKDGEGQTGGDDDAAVSETSISLNNNADAITVNSESVSAAVAPSPKPATARADDTATERTPLMGGSNNYGSGAGASGAAAAGEKEGNSSNNNGVSAENCSYFAFCYGSSCCCNCCYKKNDDTPKGSDEAVKICMLLGDTFWQLVFCLMALPLDALPWYGESKTVADSWTNFATGLECVFTCKDNFIYTLLYCSGFICMYVGCAYLNAYSPTLCSMLQQLAGPVTAVILLVVPKWNLNTGAAAWYYTVAAIVVLLVATVIYGIWEEMSELDSEEEEHLKEEEEKIKSQQHFSLDRDGDVGSASPVASE